MHARSILFVDDNDDDRQLFREAVEEVDPSVDVITCRNGEEMLALFSEQQHFIPYCIFLDIHMPVLNGIQCLIEIRKFKQLQSTPVIIYSTSMITEEIREIVALDNVYFMTKPYRFTDLRKAIRNALDKNWEDIDNARAKT